MVIYIYIFFFLAIWCLTLDPYPTANVTRYNSQTFNCSVDTNWNRVSYNYDGTTIAMFYADDGKCKGGQLSGPYKTDCDDSTRTFYLTINNVTDDYNGRIIECIVVHDVISISRIQSLINVQCK